MIEYNFQERHRANRDEYYIDQRDPYYRQEEHRLHRRGGSGEAGLGKCICNFNLSIMGLRIGGGPIRKNRDPDIRALISVCQ